MGEKHSILDDIIALAVPEHCTHRPSLPGTFVPIPFPHDSLVIYMAMHMSMHSLLGQPPNAHTWQLITRQKKRMRKEMITLGERKREEKGENKSRPLTLGKAREAT